MGSGVEMNDNNSELEELKIDRQLRKPASDTFIRKSGDGGYKRIQEALVIAAILALIGAVWNLTQTAATLQTAQQYQQREIDRLDRRQDTLEGKLTRGDEGVLSDK